MMLKLILSLLGDKVIPVIFELLGDFATKAVKNPTSASALRLYSFLKPFDAEVVDPVLAKIEQANPPAILNTVDLF